MYKVYGRIITKKPKGCSHYYEILSAGSKKDEWDQANIKLEAELTEFDDELEYDAAEFMKIVMEIIKMPFLKRLKQFMLKLLRNNLYLGKRASKIKNPEESLCFLCNDHRESRVLLFLGCETVKKQLQFLIRIALRWGTVHRPRVVERLNLIEMRFNMFVMKEQVAMIDLELKLIIPI